ncbi:MAG: M18 family aminopeptidase [Actinobacteria bacterium]|nr:M18 family aminopeptidase [Actinomycetota bacterium]
MRRAGRRAGGGERPPVSRALPPEPRRCGAADTRRPARRSSGGRSEVLRHPELDSPAVSSVRDLLRFIDASPSPYHAAETVAAHLTGGGFRVLDERDTWSLGPGDRCLVVRGGTLIAFAVPAAGVSGFRMVGAHTDSPNLRIKPRPDTGRAGYRQLGVEVYGGALRNSWLDRDLGLSGRVTVRNGGSPETRLFRVDRPLLRIPQLAIHLDRTVNDSLTLNPQQHLVPVWGLGAVDEGGFARFLAKELGVSDDAVLAWDVMVHDLTPSTVLGADAALVSAPRLDNLVSCWAATTALIDAINHPDPRADAVPVICLFDHEEIGSESATGAASTILPTVVERIVAACGGDREAYHRALAASICVSADGAHATHPNYSERHEPDHHIVMNAGPVIKINSNVRYATDAISSARFKLACEDAGVPWQEFVARTDMACGSTIGPVTAARLGIQIVDVGVAQLAMHSARELCGSTDPILFATALTSFLRGIP